LNTKGRNPVGTIREKKVGIMGDGPFSEKKKKNNNRLIHFSCRSLKGD